jgi:thiamine-monophosphate kinase
MRLSELGEFGFIARLAAPLECADPAVLIGLGDDCAVVAVGDTRWVITTDAMAEGRHFRLDWLTPRQVGARAMAAALSDIAAMGARPRFAFTTLAVPGSWEAQAALDLAGGLADTARTYGACLLGGDTVAAPDASWLDVVVIGEAGRTLWRRDAAQVGQVVCVTGALGGSAAALAGKLAGLTDIPCWARFAAPTPRLVEAQALQAVGGVTGGLDISDGLVQDAGHLCERSGVGILLHVEAIPVDPGAVAVGKALGQDSLPWALGGGEDFELLLTADSTAAAQLQVALAVPLTVIGEVVAGDHVALVDAQGHELPVGRGGWDHFTTV